MAAFRSGADIGGARQEQPRAATSRTRLSLLEISYALTASTIRSGLEWVRRSINRAGEAG